MSQYPAGAQDNYSAASGLTAVHVPPEKQHGYSEYPLVAPHAGLGGNVQDVPPPYNPHSGFPTPYSAEQQHGFSDAPPTTGYYAPPNTVPIYGEGSINTGGGAGVPYYDNTNPEQDLSPVINWKGFDDKAIRHAFVRKVYAILMLQLGFTVAMISLFIFEENVNYYVKNNLGIYIAAYITFLVVYCMISCCKKPRRSYPTNYILLVLFTLALTYLVATISSFHGTETVLIAMGICASCCLGITLFSFQTKYDFTKCGGVLFTLCWVLFMFGLISIFTSRRDGGLVQTVYAGLGALVFMLFLAYDTQMIMGGKSHELSAEEHVYAAMQLYLDVVYIFLFLLSILGGGKK